MKIEVKKSWLSALILLALAAAAIVYLAFSIVLFNTLSDILQRVLPGGAAKEV